MQGGLANFAAGFLIVVFRPFKAGDIINAAGTEGVVEEVQIFATTLNTLDNKKIIVPNGAIMGATITNYTANGTRRVDLPFAVGAASDLAAAHQVLLAAAAADPRVLKTPAPTTANIRLIDIGGTMVELRAWCKTADYPALGSDLLAGQNRLLRRAQAALNRRSGRILRCKLHFKGAGRRPAMSKRRVKLCLCG